MSVDSHSNILLIAEDDDDEFLLTEDALKESEFKGKVFRVNDGEEIMNYLLRKSPYQNPSKSPIPSVILLDLNMPKKDGRQVLKEIRSNPKLQKIPIVILTNSNADNDVATSYELGANTYIRKPNGFDDLVSIMRQINSYWLDLALLPGSKGTGHGQ